MPAGAALFAGFYLNELLLKLLARHDAARRAVRQLCRPWRSLPGADDAGVQITLRSLRAVLLRELGVLPELDQVTLTQSRRCVRGRYTLHPESGVIGGAGG
jgi:DNA repair protein RecO (recombination protein O)